MCKIMGLSNTSKIPVSELDKVLLKLRDIVCAANNDGFGYAASYKDTVFTEKFVDPKDFKGIVKSIHPKQISPFFESGEMLSEGEYYDGEMPLAIIAHGRTSTNFKGAAEYSHPFYNEAKKEAFIHNGVVDIPPGHLYGTLTNNDSEYLAHLYWDKGVKGTADAVGYFAFMNLRAGGKLDVVRDDTAHLYGAYCETLDSYILATQEYMIKEFAREFKLEISVILKISENSYARFNLGKIEKYSTFKRIERGMTLTADQKKAFKDYHDDSWQGSGGYYGRNRYYGGDYSSKKEEKAKERQKRNSGTAPMNTSKNVVPLIPGATIVENSKGERVIANAGSGESALLNNYKAPSQISDEVGKYLSCEGRYLYPGMNTDNLTEAEKNELSILESYSRSKGITFSREERAFESMKSKEEIALENEALEQLADLQAGIENAFHVNADPTPEEVNKALDNEAYYHERFLFNRKGDTV